MLKNEVFSSPFITVEYRPDSQMIYHTIHQPICDEQIELLKEALNAGTDALEKYGVTKWLSDDRRNGPLPPELVDWGTEDWNPRTIAAGWKYWANVVPTQIKAAGALTPVIEQLHKMGLRMRVFTTVEEAQEWLASVE